MARRITDREIRRAAQATGIPYGLLSALVGQESGGRSGAVSPAGARGVAQLMPGTARALEQRHKGLDTSTPYGNLLGGAYYLAEQKQRFGSWRLALAAYNAGPGAVKEYGGVPPFRETQNYVRNILAKARVSTDAGGGAVLPGATASSPQISLQGPGQPPLPGAPSLTKRDVALQGLQSLAQGQYDPMEGLQGLQEAARAAAAVPVTPGIPGGSVSLTQPQVPKNQRGPLNVGKWISVPKPAGEWPGPGEEILRFAAGIARQAGTPLTAWDTSTHSQMTTSGRVSAHTTGDALDIPAEGRELTRLGRIALMRAGMPRRQAMKQQGGLYNIGGKQIIFNSKIGGNHYDHLHIGNRRG